MTRDRTSLPLATLAVILVAALVTGYSDATPREPSARSVTPSWTKMGGIGLGTLRDAIEYRRGKGRPLNAYTKDVVTYRVPGGRVGVAYANGRVSSLWSSDPVFELPDGVVIGTLVPYRRVGGTWNGYRRCHYLVDSGSGNFAPNGWAKRVRRGRSEVIVRLVTNKQRVTQADLYGGKPYPFANPCRLD